jgi:hypothetical protein
MVDPLSVAGALTKAVESAADKGDEGSKTAEGLLLRAFGPAADEIGQALARWTALRVGNVKRVTAVADRKSLATGRDGIVNPRLARSLLEEGSYCDNELMAEYLGGILAGGRSVDGRDDRAVSWSAMINSMSSVQVLLHFILYREWAHAIHGMTDDKIAGRQDIGLIYVDADEVVRSLAAAHPELEPSAGIVHAIAGLARLDLIGSGWTTGPVAQMPPPSPPELAFESAIRATPSHAGMELYGWACGLPGFSFREFMSLPEPVEFDVEIPRPAAVLPDLPTGA